MAAVSTMEDFFLSIQPNSTAALPEPTELSFSSLASLPTFVSELSSASVKAPLFVSLSSHLHVWHLFAALYIGLSIRYLFCLLRYQRNRGPETGDQLPPIFPSFIPKYGVALSYLMAPAHFMNGTLRSAARHGLIRVQTLNLDLVFVFGPANVVDFFREAASAMPLAHWYVLTYLGGMPKKAGKKVWDDDSGFKDTPLSMSNVKPNNRVDLFLHQVLVDFLRGSNMEKIFERYAENLKIQVDENLNVGFEWVEYPDFFTFMTSQTTAPLLETICGPFLNKECPDFTTNLWEYNHYIADMLKGTPRWWKPKPYRLRKALLNDIKKWHSFANEDAEKRGPGDHSDGTFDPSWGTKFFRDRQAKFSKVDDFDADALATEDFAALWGATANTFTSAFWACYETFHDKSVLQRVRDEAAASINPDTTAKTAFDHSSLLHQPLLQSIYAEVLRLRIIIYIFRCKAEEDTKIGPWTIPPRTPMLASSSALHYDRNAWNEGHNGEHPVTDFWADRFLSYPDDPTSGPQRKDPSSVKTPSKKAASGSQPKFDMQGMAANGSWIPYGGRPRGCFGRHLARREILVIMATMASAFDIEFLSNEKVGPSEDDYGAGAQRPKEKIPFRIRRRNARRDSCQDT